MKPLIVIVGPTASGKTSLAIQLALKHDGEIICADSRTVYAGMDIGTAKPTAREQSLVPHWGLDLVAPDERFTAADFKRYADNKIHDIRSRGKLPILAGGTGLYIDAVVFDYQFGNVSNPEQRAELEKLSIHDLHKHCIKNNIMLPENKWNRRYVIRAIEQKTINGIRRTAPIDATVIVGIATDRAVLRSRIAERAEHIFSDSVVDEAIKLGKMYGWESEAMTGNIYPLVHSYLLNELSMSEMKEKFTTLDWRLAKRQLTWLRRNPYIKWLDLTEVNQYVARLLETPEQS